MKRGFPFQPKPDQPQQVQVTIDLSQENIRNCFITSQVIGKTPTEVANTVMSIGFLHLQTKRLTEGLVMQIMAAEAQRAAEAVAPEKPKDEEDPMTPEERLKENRKLAGLDPQ
jgi:hypothetical protein